MRYFLTGGTGFIGGELARQLRSAGHDVIALVRSPARAGRLVEMGADLTEGDLQDPDSLREGMKGCDGVFHLAAWYEVGTDPRNARAINVDGTRNVLEAMRDLNIAKGVYTSSLAVNSDTGGRVVDEDYVHRGPHLSVYDQTKWEAHHSVAAPMIDEGLPLVITMPGIVYGPSDTSMLGGIMRDAVRGNLVTLPGPPTGGCWAHVEDTARGHVLAMERAAAGSTYMLCGPAHTYQEAFRVAAQAAGVKLRAAFLPPAALRTMAPIVDAVGRVLPVPAKLSGEAMRVTGGTTYYGDSSRAQRDLGFSPRPLREGMVQTFSL